VFKKLAALPIPKLDLLGTFCTLGKRRGMRQEKGKLGVERGEKQEGDKCFWLHKMEYHNGAASMRQYIIL